MGQVWRRWRRARPVALGRCGAARVRSEIRYLWCSVFGTPGFGCFGVALVRARGRAQGLHHRKP